MVSPRILSRASSRMPFAVTRAEGSVCHLPRKGLRRHLERHQLTGLPEVRRKLMREEQGIVAPFAGQHLYRLLRILPRQAKLADVPPPELKPIGARLANQKLKQLKPCHRIRSNSKGIVYV